MSNYLEYFIKTSMASNTIDIDIYIYDNDRNLVQVDKDLVNSCTPISPDRKITLYRNCDPALPQPIGYQIDDETPVFDKGDSNFTIPSNPKSGRLYRYLYDKDGNSIGRLYENMTLIDTKRYSPLPLDKSLTPALGFTYYITGELINIQEHNQKLLYEYTGYPNEDISRYNYLIFKDTNNDFEGFSGSTGSSSSYEFNDPNLLTCSCKITETLCC